MPTARWMEQANQAPVHEVFVASGLEKIGKGYGPCPVCGAEHRGSKDKRGAIISGSKPGWKCAACKAKGDLLNLLGYCQSGKTLKELDEEGRDTVRDWFASRGWCEPKGTAEGLSGDRPPVAPPPPSAPYEAQEPNYPPQDEVKRLWEASAKINGNLDRELKDFFWQRRWDPKRLAEASVCRISPQANDIDSWPAWWPRGRAATWRLLVPAFTPKGALTSLHGRATAPVHNGTPKVVWPKGKDAVDLIMADLDGWLLLKGRKKPKLVIICEGLTDLIALSVHKNELGRNVAILGCASGGFSALRYVDWPKWVPVYCATDPDKVGDEYARQIATAISPTPLRRLPLAHRNGQKSHGRRPATP